MQQKFSNTVSRNSNSFQINHQPDATIFRFIILTFIYSSTCFGRFPAHHQEVNDFSGSLWFYLPIMVTVVLYLGNRQYGNNIQALYQLPPPPLFVFVFGEFTFKVIEFNSLITTSVWATPRL